MGMRVNALLLGAAESLAIGDVKLEIPALFAQKWHHDESVRRVHRSRFSVAGNIGKRLEVVGAGHSGLRMRDAITLTVADGHRASSSRVESGVVSYNRESPGRGTA